MNRSFERETVMARGLYFDQTCDWHGTHVAREWEPLMNADQRRWRARDGAWCQAAAIAFSMTGRNSWEAAARPENGFAVNLL
jgi:hypothetical protein